MSGLTAARDRIVRNPFYILGVRPDCSRVEMERAGQRLLGMLELSLAEAAAYRTPMGTFPLTADLVRQAMADLREPARRLEHEFWAWLEPGAFPVQAPSCTSVPFAGAWPDIMADLGW